MRDPELMLALLKEMSEDAGGYLTVARTLGMSPDERKYYHHVELLVDAGHAVWTSPRADIARITNDGYDFLNATANPNTGAQVRARFIQLFNNGLPYVQAVTSAMDLWTC